MSQPNETSTYRKKKMLITTEDEKLFEDQEKLTPILYCLFKLKRAHSATVYIAAIIFSFSFFHL